MDTKKKVKKMEGLAEELKSLEGVKYAMLDDYAPKTANSGQIAVRIDFKDSWREYGEGQQYKLDADLRSISQKMRYMLEDSDLIGYTVYEKPERVYNAVREGVGHDSNLYMVEVIP